MERDDDFYGRLPVRTISAEWSDEPSPLAVPTSVDPESNIIRAAEDAAARAFDEAQQRGEPKLTSNQSAILKVLLAGLGLHAWGIAKELDMSPDSVRTALMSLESKGLVRTNGMEVSDEGPARKLYQVISPERALAAIRAEDRSRRAEIAKLQGRINELKQAARIGGRKNNDVLIEDKGNDKLRGGGYEDLGHARNGTLNGANL